MYVMLLKYPSVVPHAFGKGEGDYLFKYLKQLLRWILVAYKEASKDILREFSHLSEHGIRAKKTIIILLCICDSS